MKPVCLFFFANDVEIVGRNLRKLAVEARAIESAMEQASRICDVHVIKNTTADDIRRTLAKFRHKVSVVHYAGHAESLQLMLETDAGGKEGFRNETMAEYLRNQDNIELVFLNGCSTGDQVEAPLAVGVPYVISTNRAVDDNDATSLSSAFYEGLAAGSTIDESWREAIAATRQKRSLVEDENHSGSGETGQSRGAVFTKKSDSVSKTSGFAWSLQSRPGIDPVPKWNLPEASNNPLLGLPALSEDVGYPEEPFQHLRRFTREEARVFFGRGNEILSLFGDITSKHGPPVTLYYGQSGVGKSSLLDAGLLPRLENDYEVVYVRRSANGIAFDVMQEFGEPNGESKDWLLKSWKARESSGKPLVLILDQLEEAWTHGTRLDGTAEIEKLAAWLGETFRIKSKQPAGKAILVFRKEWYPEIDSILKTQKVARSGVFLKRLTAESVARAITLNDESRDYYNLTVDEDLAKRIATELTADSESPLAPTLQILLADMWKVAKKASRNHPEFSTQLYQKLKHQGIQLKDFLESQLAKVAMRDPHGSENGLLLSVLRFHCSDLGTAAVRTVSDRHEFFGKNADKADAIVQCCRQHFLIVDTSSESEESDGVTRLAHDTLAPLVLKRFHESNRRAQHASRILALRAQVVDEATPDSLTRRELKVVHKAQPWMRKFSEAEEALLEQSQSKINRANLKSWCLLAALAVVLLSAAWWVRGALNSAEVNRRIEIIQNADTPALVANKSNFEHRPSLSWDAIRSIENGSQNEGHVKTNTTILKSLLGEPKVSEIVEQFKQADPEDVPGFCEALRDIANEDLQPLRNLIALQVVLNEEEMEPTAWNDIIQMRAKLTWLCLLMGKSELVDPSWYRPNEQAESRTLLIKALADWFLDQDDYVRAIGQPNDFHLQAVLCQSVFFISNSQLDEQLREYLEEILAASYEHDHIAVRSSARAALTRLNLLEAVQEKSSRRNGKDWFSICYTTKANATALLDFAQVRIGDQRKIWLATTETPWSLSDGHLSDEALQARSRRLKLSNGVSDSSDVDFPARFVDWSDAIECCQNLTSHFLNDASAYSKPTQSTAGPMNKWDQIKDGFRLPTASEWKVAAAANSGDNYCFGDRFDLLQHFAWTRETADESAHAVAQLLPNAYGFFDMHGNVQEWCWPATTANLPMESRGETELIKTRDGSYMEKRSESMLTHEGDDLPGTKRAWYMGFRLAISERPELIKNMESQKK